MSVIPARFAINILQGSTFDETYVFYLARASENDPLVPLDITGWSARMKIRRDHDGPEIISLESGVAAPPAADGIQVGNSDGTVRVYIRDETTAAMLPTQWTKRGVAPADVRYLGVWDLELVNPAGEVFREVQGEVRFSREVTR